MELLCYCEGNLDAGDCYHAFALARNVIHKELWSKDGRHRRSAVLYWSALWLIKASWSNTLLPRITALASLTNRPSFDSLVCLSDDRRGMGPGERESGNEAVEVGAGHGLRAGWTCGSCMGIRRGAIQGRGGERAPRHYWRRMAGLFCMFVMPAIACTGTTDENTFGS